MLAEKWPTLRLYCPPLWSVSAPQTAFLSLDCTEAFYGGAVGGGKTAALLMGALQYVDVPGYAALILRRTFPELEQPDGPISQSLRWFADAPEAVRPIYNRSDHEWTFPSGAVIRFGHLDHANAMIRYQGGGYHFFGFDELTHFDERSYEFIGFSRTRRPPEGPLSKVPMRVRATANPGGPGHLWVKDRFISKREPGVMFIPARLEDNPGIDYADYVSRLELLDPILRQQLLEGDWGAFEGAAFTITDEHLVDEFKLQDSFDRFEVCDYGLNGAPWSLWTVDYEGNIVVADMLYERDRLPSDLAPLVVAKRKGGWGHGHVAYADPSIWHRTGTKNRFGDPAMLADEFSDNGVPLVRANNDPRAGLIRVRELLTLDPSHPFPPWHSRAGEMGAPRLFFHRTNCARLVEELRGAPLQPIDKQDGGEKVDPEWESQYGHSVAMTRYGAMSRPSASVEPERPFEDPAEAERWLREQALTEREKQWESKQDARPSYTI